MDCSLKPCTTTCSVVWDAQNHNFRELLVDRLTTLPDELLIQILSLLPTKDAATTSVLSRRLRRVFALITSLDFDFDFSPVSHCSKYPYAIERFSTFITFVDTVLQSHMSQYLSSFKLRFCWKRSRFTRCCDWCPYHYRDCLPDLKFTRFQAWISFPLTFCGLRELDLCIRVKEPGDAQLPPAIFMCETLQVLKLEVNLGLDQVIAMPSYRLPRLKILCLNVFFASDDDFLPRLVSSCPLLEELTYEAFTNHVYHTSIYSTSLRKLCLLMMKTDAAHGDNSDLVLIHAPNLEYLEYLDNIACNYSIPLMPCLVKADLTIDDDLTDESILVSFEKLISLFRPLSCVKHLCLFGCIMSCLMEVFDYAGEKFLKDQLPMFPNLKHLELDYASQCIYWDSMLLPLLACSPSLETIMFHGGLMMCYTVCYIDKEGLVAYYTPDDFGYEKESLELELEYFRTAQAIPSCFRNHLKRIVIKEYVGVLEREVEIIKFFLRHALVLEELVICRTKKTNVPFPDQFPDQLLLENTMKNLPRASVTCSIQVF